MKKILLFTLIFAVCFSCKENKEAKALRESELKEKWNEWYNSVINDKWMYVYEDDIVHLSKDCKIKMTTNEYDHIYTRGLRFVPKTKVNINKYLIDGSFLCPTCFYGDVLERLMLKYDVDDCWDDEWVDYVDDDGVSRIRHKKDLTNIFD